MGYGLCVNVLSLPWQVTTKLKSRHINYFTILYIRSLTQISPGYSADVGRAVLLLEALGESPSACSVQRPEVGDIPCLLSRFLRLESRSDAHLCNPSSITKPLSEHRWEKF